MFKPGTLPIPKSTLADPHIGTLTTLRLGLLVSDIGLALQLESTSHTHVNFLEDIGNLDSMDNPVI